MQKKFNKKIIISDATLRDGNHAIGHQINKTQLSLYCKAAERACIDIVEKFHIIIIPETIIAPVR